MEVKEYFVGKKKFKSKREALRYAKKINAKRIKVVTYEEEYKNLRFKLY